MDFGRHKELKELQKLSSFASFKATDEAHWELFTEAASQVLLSPTQPPDSCFFSIKYSLLGNLSMTSIGD